MITQSPRLLRSGRVGARGSHSSTLLTLSICSCPIRDAYPDKIMALCIDVNTLCKVRTTLLRGKELVSSKIDADQLADVSGEIRKKRGLPDPRNFFLSVRFRQA